MSEPDFHRYRHGALIRESVMPNRSFYALFSATLISISCGDAGTLEVHGGDFEDDVLVAPTDTVRQPLDGTQRVFVDFDGPRIDDCDGYCSDARTNTSWAIEAHFGRSSIDFAPWGSASQRSAVVSSLSDAFAPYDVDIVTRRPTSGPYQMLVVSSTPGPASGVAPLDCDNSNPNDIAFVYEVGDTPTAWVGQAAAHELGHSFGLSHVTGSGDYMHYNASGASFTRSGWDSARSNAKCFDGNTQDAPVMLRDALGAHGRPQPPACSMVRRAAGATRHHTAVEISRLLFPNGAPAVVLVRDQDQNPDALAAAPLAAAKGGPILLTPSSGLAGVTREEIRRLDPSTVWIVGGTSAVSGSIASDLRGDGRNVVRLAGASRWETGAKVARSVGADGLAFVASGENAHLVDALAGSGIAAAMGAPVLLVARDAIPAPTAGVLADLDVNRTVVLGGDVAVSDAVVGQLPNPTRISGASRYETARAIADWAADHGIASDDVFVARGDLGPDALAGGAAAKILLLTPPDGLHPTAKHFLRTRSTTVTLLGGTGALSSDVEYATCSSLQ